MLDKNLYKRLARKYFTELYSILKKEGFDKVNKFRGSDKIKSVKFTKYGRTIWITHDFGSDYLIVEIDNDKEEFFSIFPAKWKALKMFDEFVEYVEANIDKEA